MKNGRTKWHSAIRQESTAWMGMLAAVIPGRLGMWMRRGCFRLFGVKVGSRLISDRGSQLHGGAGIRLGDNVYLAADCRVYAEDGNCVIGSDSEIGIGTIVDASIGEIAIGQSVMIAAGVSLRCTNHATADTTRPMKGQGHERGRILIEDDVWIGTHATILPNTSIGAHSIVGAGAVVTTDVPPWAIVMGNPAQIVGFRSKPEEIV